MLLAHNPGGCAPPPPAPPPLPTPPSCGLAHLSYAPLLAGWLGTLCWYRPWARMCWLPSRSTQGCWPPTLLRLRRAWPRGQVGVAAWAGAAGQGQGHLLLIGGQSAAARLGGRWLWFGGWCDGSCPETLGASHLVAPLHPLPCHSPRFSLLCNILHPLPGQLCCTSAPTRSIL